MFVSHIPSLVIPTSSRLVIYSFTYLFILYFTLHLSSVTYHFGPTEDLRICPNVITLENTDLP